MQNAPTDTSSGAASSTAAVTHVLDRAPRIEAPRTFSISSPSSRAPLSDSTSNPASSNCETATPLMFSSNRTFKYPPRTSSQLMNENYNGVGFVSGYRFSDTANRNQAHPKSVYENSGDNPVERRARIQPRRDGPVLTLDVLNGKTSSGAL